MSGLRGEGRLDVVGVGMRDRADDRQPVHQLGRLRKQLAELHAGDACVDGAELAPHG
jgi:hypothetical protein